LSLLPLGKKSNIFKRIKTPRPEPLPWLICVTRLITALIWLNFFRPKTWQTLKFLLTL